jgi:hypothetical protein
MIRQLDEQIRDAYRHAEECALRAKATRDRQGREDWLLLEDRYLSLAQGLELSRRLELVEKEEKAKQKRPGRFRSPKVITLEAPEEGYSNRAQ